MLSDIDLSINRKANVKNFHVPIFFSCISVNMKRLLHNQIPVSFLWFHCQRTSWVFERAK